MSIIVNNGVTNVKNSPSLISDLFSNQPNANIVNNGTLFFATDTAAIYQAVAGSWVNYSGGGGGGGNTIDEVLFNGATSLDKNQFFDQVNTLQEIAIYGSADPQYILLTDDKNTLTNFCYLRYNVFQMISNNGLFGTTIFPNYIACLSTVSQFIIGTGAFEHRENVGNKTFKLDFDNTEHNNQILLFPEDTGTIALQNPPVTYPNVNLSSSNFTPTVEKNQTVIITTGSITNSFILDTGAFIDKLTLEICVKDIPVNLTSSNTIYGLTSLPLGLSYIKRVGNDFFISR